VFCAVSDLEAVLQLAIPPERMAAAEFAICAATAAIQGYCHQTVSQVEDDELTLDVPQSTMRLFLPELPVTKVSAVVEAGEALVEGEHYEVGQHGILYRVGAYWAAGIGMVRVTYTHGYAEIPADIVAVCARAAARAYQAGLRAAELAGVPGVTSTQLGDYSVSYGAESGAAGEGVLGVSAPPLLLRSEKEILNRYRYVAP
jgi:hypothetical protein